MFHWLVKVRYNLQLFYVSVADNALMATALLIDGILLLKFTSFAVGGCLPIGMVNIAGLIYCSVLSVAVKVKVVVLMKVPFGSSLM
jgi:hypothetical protein